jgi:hypothetical protein
VAFRVAFGAQNQTVFKNVSLSQQEHRETGEYFKALSDLVDKRGGTQKTYVGTDLLRLFKTRSYTCKVDAMGCMNIQPLMYFDLQNVPFFNGAYLITSVSHNITPNQMSTNFEGVRQSKFISPPTEEITADLDIDLNEISDVPKIEYTNLTTVSGFGVREGIEPDDLFDYKTNFTNNGLDNFKLLGVSAKTNSDLTKIISSLEELFLLYGIRTNTEVTMLLSAMLANSNNFLNKEMSWDDPNREEHSVKFPNSDPSSGQTRYYTYKPGEGILASTPTKTSGIDADKAYLIPGNEILNEFKENDNIEAEKKEIKEKIKILNSAIPEDAAKIKILEKQFKDLEKRDKEQITSTNYYNIFEGDAYRFRPRGFLYIVGRKQYYQLYQEFYKERGITSGCTDCTDMDGGNDGSIDAPIWSPYLASATVDAAIQASVIQWKHFKGIKGEKPQTSYFYTSQKGNGTLATYKVCTEIAYQYSPPTVDKSIETFQNVLTIFLGKDGKPLIDYFKPA